MKSTGCLDRVDALVADLDLIGCHPHAAFSRDRTIVWHALCPHQGLLDGHTLVLRAGADREPLIECECGACPERVLAEIEHQRGGAESAVGDFLWAA